MNLELTIAALFALAVYTFVIAFIFGLGVAVASRVLSVIKTININYNNRDKEDKN